jgi:hypothetical protein
MSVAKGPLAGATVRILSKSTNSVVPVAHSQLMVSQTQTNWLVNVAANGVKANLATSLAAYGYTVAIDRGGTNSSAAFYAMVIESRSIPPLWWFCTRPTSDTTVPRDFKVFTSTNGNTYACYIQNGPRIFRVQRMKDMYTAWRDYWEHDQEQSGTIAPLRMDVLRQAVGDIAWIHFGSDYFLGVADDVFEVNGELRIQLHGRKPEPKHTFALRNDKWEWVSSTGKEMTFAQIEEEQRKALSEQFEAGTKKLYGKTNEASGAKQESGSRTNK